MRQTLEQHLTDDALVAVRLISGYLSPDSISWLTAVVEKRAEIELELICGMGLREGLPGEQYSLLKALDQSLRFPDPRPNSGVFVFAAGPEASRRRGMHAKAYLFTYRDRDELVIGSSNFSASGLGDIDNSGNYEGNIEANVVITSHDIIKSHKSFYDLLHANYRDYGMAQSTRLTRDKIMVVPLQSIEPFPIRGAAKRARQSTYGATTRVPVRADFKSLPFVDIDLSRNIDAQTGSNLNCCFGKGRWQRASGKIAPRDWYEVEIMAGASVTHDPNYPRGEFNVETHDGRMFRAKTGGDNYKNLRSKGDLKILGTWIKGLLEDAGVLSDNPQSLVTRDVLDAYGNSVLRLYRKNSDTYIFNFPRDPSDL